MTRVVIVISVSCVLAAASPARLFAQAGPKPAGGDPRSRRALREQAVTFAGPAVRGLVEALGDEAVAALLACSKPVAVRLAQFHDGGGLAKLPRPRDLLLAIAKPGCRDDVALFAIAHAAELADADCFDAYVLSPLDYALSLKKLEAGADEVRARRASRAAMQAKWLEQQAVQHKVNTAAVLGLVAVIGFVAWRRRQAMWW